MTEKQLDNIDGLAAEHALGSLPPAERAAVARRLAEHEGLASAVTAWEKRLAPLSLREPGIAPPPDALEGILAGLAARAGTRRNEHVDGLRRSLVRWRAAAGIAAMAAALALVVPAGLLAWRPPVGYVVLAARATDAADEALTQSRPIFFAMAESKNRTISLRQVSGRMAPGGRSYVLWIGDGVGQGYRRVGALARDEQVRSFPVEVPVAVGASILLTAETEPLPASPTGPVIASGRLMTAEP